jgi:hypothetical protein
MPTDSDLTPHYSVSKRVLNFGGWGTNTYNVTLWTPDSVKSLLNNINSIVKYCKAYNYNSISLDIEGCTDTPSAKISGTLSQDGKKYTYKTKPAPGSKLFGTAVNSLLIELRKNGLITIMTIPGFGVADTRGGMDWFTYIHPNNMDRICFMYYNLSCDTEIAPYPGGRGYTTEAILCNTYGLLFSPLYDNKRILGTSCGYGCSSFKGNKVDFDPCIKQLFNAGVSVWRKSLPFLRFDGNNWNEKVCANHSGKFPCIPYYCPLTIMNTTLPSPRTGLGTQDNPNVQWNPHNWAGGPNGADDDYKKLLPYCKDHNTCPKPSCNDIFPGSEDSNYKTGKINTWWMETPNSNDPEKVTSDTVCCPLELTNANNDPLASDQPTLPTGTARRVVSTSTSSTLCALDDDSSTKQGGFNTTTMQRNLGYKKDKCQYLDPSKKDTPPCKNGEGTTGCCKFAIADVSNPVEGTFTRLDKTLNLFPNEKNPTTNVVKQMQPSEYLCRRAIAKGNFNNYQQQERRATDSGTYKPNAMGWGTYKDDILSRGKLNDQLPLPADNDEQWKVNTPSGVTNFMPSLFCRNTTGKDINQPIQLTSYAENASGWDSTHVKNLTGKYQNTFCNVLNTDPVLDTDIGPPDPLYHQPWLNTDYGPAGLCTIYV